MTPTRVKINDVLSAGDLRSLNELLTQSMKSQQHQELIRDDQLEKIVDKVLSIANASDKQDELFASAVLGRLAAVARGREETVYSTIDDLFSGVPPSIETLADGDEKEYAAKSIAHVGAKWKVDYCAREALTIDSANNARKELLKTVLGSAGSVAEAVRTLSAHQSVVRSIEQPDTRAKRIRRSFDALVDAVNAYDGPVGSDAGAALSELMLGFLRGATDSDSDAINGAIDAVAALLVRIIELRFSHALYAETYRVLVDGKNLLGPGKWARFLEGSSRIAKIQLNLLETSLVLARQNRTDKEILRVMESSWPSTATISGAIRQHFSTAVDIDPVVADYWLKVGRVTQSERAAEHKLGNIEDQQIGELLIQLGANRENMSKLHRAVVPVLETFDPIQAATVKKAASGYEGIAQIAERLARMRKLSKTNCLGERVEYNPIEHDMEGGHRSGVRYVRVVRDGILKEFGGRMKTLVKPRVEAEE